MPCIAKKVKKDEEVLNVPDEESFKESKPEPEDNEKEQVEHTEPVEHTSEDQPDRNNRVAD